MLPNTNLESSDTRTLIRVLEDHKDVRAETRIRKELIMRDYVSYKEMATNELNHNNRLKERLQQLKASNERDRENINKISSINGTIRSCAHSNIKFIAETQMKQFNESLQVKQTNFEKHLEEHVTCLTGARSIVMAYQMKQCEVAALELSHQETTEQENAEKDRMKNEKLTMVTLFQRSIVELADYFQQYHEIANKIVELHNKTATEPSPSKARAMAPYLRPKPSQLSPSKSNQSNQMMTSTSTHQKAIVSSQKIQMPKKRKIVDVVPSDSGFNANLSDDGSVESSKSFFKVTVMNGIPIGISSEKNDANVVIQEINEIANDRMDDGDIENDVNHEIDETSSSYDIAAILQESINYAKTLKIYVNDSAANSDTEYDEESIELLK